MHENNSLISLTEPPASPIENPEYSLTALIAFCPCPTFINSSPAEVYQCLQVPLFPPALPCNFKPLHLGKNSISKAKHQRPLNMGHSIGF